MRWAVDLHGGRIEVADSLQGATMRLTFPARPQPHTTGLPDDLPEILGRPGTPRPNDHERRPSDTTE